MTLDKLEVGKDAVIESVGGKGALRRHFLDMGLTPGTEVTMMKKAPMGDPIELRLRSYELTLRLADAAQIEISGIHDTDTVRSRQAHLKDIPHPQVGEMGIYHVRKKGNELREGEPLTFGLIGNQNCGKTTLFNQLTGANQHVGNFPGVTVDRKDGQIKNHPEATVTDLPGIYSLSPYTNEEIVTRDFLIQNKPRGIINIVDATNIERNLYLTMQLIEMDIPMVLALNMMDEVRENGGTIQVNRLEEALGIPVIPISAAKNEGRGKEQVWRSIRRKGGKITGEKIKDLSYKYPGENGFQPQGGSDSGERAWRLCGRDSYRNDDGLHRNRRISSFYSEGT